MIAQHIHHALEQVQELQQRILEKQRFRGYSGRARMAGGVLALLTAIVLATPGIPPTPAAHLQAWGILLALALILNFGSVIYRLMIAPGGAWDVRRLRPVMDTLPPILVGAILSIALVRHGQFDALFGTWMCLFSLSHFVTRQVLPAQMTLVGGVYLACGTVCLLLPMGSFVNPWPMGLVFFVGEGAGGLLFWLDEQSARAAGKSAHPTYLQTGRNG
ncbi:hypothetical protein [Candidatus Entotheonella palauensis]|uniref:hypothetical protein n=1 Tax=Candidatus Entotheonella palauensis TaxID=93172 RepID=UPI000B7EF88C|nr:hypothetical protein [Candidatus Entotheonella palauensis]